jgi:hypothetical protein
MKLRELLSQTRLDIKNHIAEQAYWLLSREINPLILLEELSQNTDNVKEDELTFTIAKLLTDFYAPDNLEKIINILEAATVIVTPERDEFDRNIIVDIRLYSESFHKDRDHKYARKLMISFISPTDPEKYINFPAGETTGLVLDVLSSAGGAWMSIEEILDELKNKKQKVAKNINRNAITIALAAINKYKPSKSPVKIEFYHKKNKLNKNVIQQVRLVIK